MKSHQENVFQVQLHLLPAQVHGSSLSCVSPVDLKRVFDALLIFFFFFFRTCLHPKVISNLSICVLSSKGNSQNSNHQQVATPQEVSVPKSQFDIQEHKIVSTNKFCTTNTTHVISLTHDHNKI